MLLSSTSLLLLAVLTIMDNARHWKNKTFKLMEASLYPLLVAVYIEQASNSPFTQDYVLNLTDIDDNEGDGTIRVCTDADTLHQFLRRKYSKENFLFVFSFINGYLNPNRCTETGQLFLKK